MSKIFLYPNVSNYIPKNLFKFFCFRTCEQVCCEGSNCNNATIAAIKQKQRERTTEIMQTTQPLESGDNATWPLALVSLFGVGALVLAAYKLS